MSPFSCCKTVYSAAHRGQPGNQGFASFIDRGTFSQRLPDEGLCYRYQIFETMPQFLLSIFEADICIGFLRRVSRSRIR